MATKQATRVKRQKLGPWQEAWLQTLESGWFRQGRHLLCEETEEGCAFCCLGLAYEVLIDNGVPISSQKCGESTTWSYGGHWWGCLGADAIQTYRFHGERGAIVFKRLPERLRAKAHEATQGRDELATLNDKGWTFAQIAAFVRKYPEAVFSGPA